MRGNKISSKKNCFLGEAPKHVCVERDSRKEKKWKISSKEEIEMIKNHHSIIKRYLASFLCIFFLLLRITYHIKISWQANFTLYQYEGSSL